MEGRNLEFATRQQLLSLVGDRDCCYCGISVTATMAHITKKHLKSAVYYSDGVMEKFSIPCHCPARGRGKRCHWHCAKCEKIILRSIDFKAHLKRHGLVVAVGPSGDGETCQDTTPADQVQDTTHVDEVQKGTLLCNTCGIHFSNRSNLNRHEREHHAKQEPMLCVDTINGIYVTPKEAHGLRLPIHVQKSSITQRFACEVDACMDFMSICANTGNPGKECFHLYRTETATSYSPPKALKKESLQEMAEKGLFSKFRLAACTALNNMACDENVDCVFPFFWSEQGLSERYIFFSVFTGKQDNWCKLRRTICTFDSKLGKWHCRCGDINNKINCVHIYLSMWWLFQENPLLLKNSKNTPMEDIEDVNEISPLYDSQQHFEMEESDVIAQTDYLWNSKRIPEERPFDLNMVDRPVPDSFEPKEVKCPYCPGPCPPDLKRKILITRQATVYGCFKVSKGVSVYSKECPCCKNLVRFQEYESGFHNYNNRVFLSIPLCYYLTTGISNHIAVGSALRVFEQCIKSALPVNTISKAFYHFCALTQYSYDFFCYRCGHHPSVVIADTNWKVSFDLPVELMRRPDIDENLGPQDTKVDVAARWDNLEKEIVATGFCEDSANNPFTSPLTYSSFVPWIGKNTRVNDQLPKTEIYKGLSQSQRVNSGLRECREVDEDQILQILDSRSPKREDLLAACNSLGVSATGSKTDLINRLEELLLYKDIYPKMFVKLQKAGGGVLHMGCTHGVVYYASPLWWQESARDHGDALLSFRHPPTVYISDIAGRVARHVNNRTQQRFFKPNDGRVCAPTTDNIKLATKGKLTVDLDWMKQRRRKPRAEEQHKEMEQFSCPHPETGTTDRYSLYDRFHQKNQSRPEEKLRSLKFVPDLASVINSSAAEQINRELSASRYSLCQMKDIHFMFSLRLYFHLHNKAVNSAFMKEIEKQSISEPIAIGLNGKLTFGRTEQSKNPQGQEKGESTTADGYQFSLSMFPTDEEDKDKLSNLYSVEKTDGKVITTVSHYNLLEVRDLKSICPPDLLKENSMEFMPWLSDNAVNCRVAQIAAERQDIIALATDNFILWYRDWVAYKKISDTHVEMLKNNAEKIFIPRIVGGQTPETGSHFILWVFDKKDKEIRIYDNTLRHHTISPSDMAILKDAFRHVDSLEGWTTRNPQQWHRDDGRNCGVFVCTMAEMEARGVTMSPELLQTQQLIFLRVYHATCLVKNIQTEVSSTLQL